MKDINPISQPVFRRKEPGIQPDASLISALLNLLPDAAIMVHRVQGVVYTANSAFLRLTVFSQKELAGAPLRMLLPSLDASLLSSGETHTAALNRRQRSALDVQVQVSSLDEAGQWVLLTMLSQGDSQRDLEQFYEKMFAALLGLMKLYEFETIEDALAEVSKILSTLLDTPLVCVYQAEAEYPQLRKVATVEGVTPVFPEILPASELANLDSDLLWSPGKRVVSEAQRAGRMEKLAYVLEVPLGQPGALVGLIVAADRHHSLPERNVRVLGLLGSAISSILQQLQLVRKLQEDIAHWEDHRRVWDAVVENDVAGVIVLKPDLTITEMNLAAEELLEYPGGEVIGHHVDTVLISTDRILPTLEAALQGVQTPNLGMLSLHRRSGQVFPAHVQVVPVMAGDEVSAIIIYILDISDEEAIRARTQQLEHRAVLGEVTAMFAHEVRNPINNLWTGVQLLATRLDESDVNQELIARMDSDCNRLNHLMEDVLAYSRPYDPRMEETDLVNLLKRICDRWRPRIARKNLQFFFKAEEEIPNIIADTRALDQVFTNLISNAIEAMADNGGMLAVGVGMNIIENRPHVEVTVTDNGPGIPEDVKERIFEPFVTTKQLGTGLGLAITKRIVNAHRGTIICNTYPGCTVFHILLPTAEGD